MSEVVPSCRSATRTTGICLVFGHPGQREKVAVRIEGEVWFILKAKAEPARSWTLPRGIEGEVWFILKAYERRREEENTGWFASR